MNAEEAGEYCAVLRPKVAVPTHYAFTAGPIRDRLFLKYNGTPERFQRAVARHAPRPASGCWRPANPSRSTAERPAQAAARALSRRPTRPVTS